MKYESRIWQDKDGSNYLIFHTSTTHTGTHEKISWTPEIDKATIARYLPMSKEIRSMIVPVKVEVETTVKLIEE